MDEISRQLKKGALDIIVLKLLDGKEMYGYELMQMLETAGGGYFAMREGTLYPILYRLEDAGYIQSNWEKDQVKRGMPRKYYALTSNGQRHLGKAKTELGYFISTIKSILGV